MSGAPKPRPSTALDLPWRILASRITSALLGLVLAATAVIAVTVPQGKEALALARESHATTLQALAAWGLTNVYDSDWFRALIALIAGNVTAVLVTAALSRRGTPNVAPPRETAVAHDLITPHPEHAVEMTRAVLAAQLGLPVAEVAEGARAQFVFDVGRTAHIGPVLVHAGLMMLVLGAGLYASQASQGVPRAVLDISDPRSHSTGRFDIVAGESFSFFRSPETYILRDYVPSREGLGPAIRLERTAERERPQELWVYARAPVGFDARHRRGEVNIEARWMGLAPKPGNGLSGSALSALMLMGLAMVGLGVGGTRRARGRVWTDIEGDRIVISGTPERPGDAAFERAVEHAARTLERLLAE